MNTQKQKKIKKDVARLLSILLVVVSLSFPQKNIYASYLGESLSGENENLTEDEISRIKEMAKDTSYIRDEDDFDSIEAYNMYIKYCKESKNIKSLLQNVDFTFSNTINSRVAGNISAKKEITLIGLGGKQLDKNSVTSNAIQAFYIGSKYVYTVQKSSKNVYLSRLLLSADKTKATFVDQMILEDFGHCQTLQYFEWKNTPYFWMACRADNGKETNNSGTPYFWSLEIARVKYEPGVTHGYKYYKRLTDITKANKTQIAMGKTKRCDAALSSDKKTLLVWCRNTDNKMQFSRCDTSSVNKALDAEKSNELSCGSSKLKNAFLASFSRSSANIFSEAESKSVQGLELNNANCTYIASGPSKANKYIIKLDKNGYIISTRVIANKELVSGTLSEIEGLQLKGDRVYFGICMHNSEQKNGIQYIYSVNKSYF